MSVEDVGRIGLTIGGAFFFGPVGALAGNILGQVLLPQRLPGVEGPRLEDLTLTRSQDGTPIPWVAGTYTVPGNVIDGEPQLTEIATTSTVGGKGGGKGGQSQTTYAYYATFALAIGEGPIDGIRRIWADGALVYDNRCEITEREETVVVIERDPSRTGAFSPISQLAWQLTVEQNNQVEQFMTVYLGTEDQEPAPELELIHGMGEVPAYRGQAYLMFDGLPLEKFGNRIPQFLVEVARSLPPVPESPTLSNDNEGWDILPVAA